LKKIAIFTLFYIRELSLKITVFMKTW